MDTVVPGAAPLLQVRGLRMQIDTALGALPILDGVDFDVDRGRTVCIVGESGCGKSMTARSILRLVPPPLRLAAGQILLHPPARPPADLAAMAPFGTAIRAIRGRDVGMIFQEPMTALSPVHTIGNQMVEAIRLHQPIGRREARERAAEMLHRVGLPRPVDRLDAYTFQLSGGMRQRAMIALALVCNPSLLIADEPTTALDVTMQAQVLDLMRTLRTSSEMSILFITHDLGVVAEMADEVLVMYLGQVVERGSVAQVLYDARHPYTRALLRSNPGLDTARRNRLHAIAGTVPGPLNRPRGCPFHDRCEEAVPGQCDQIEPPPVTVAPGHLARCLFAAEPPPQVREPAVEPAYRTSASVTVTPLLQIKDLEMHFGGGRRWIGARPAPIRAVCGVTLDIYPGETMGLVGESGCGKTTTGRCIIRILEPTGGSILYRGEDGRDVDLAQLEEAALRPYHRQIRMIFQDPFSSLDPRMTVARIVGEPIRVGRAASGSALDDRVASLVRRVGLRPEHLSRYPHAFSGGERQRIGIARALALDPRLVVCDEAVSALDVSVQAQILNLLRDLQDELQLTYLFIAHDLSVVRHICDRVAVMYAGRIVELGPTPDVFAAPLHPYTSALLSAAPSLHGGPGGPRSRIILAGEVPDPSRLPTGCAFHPRCSHSDGARCVTEAPPMTARGEGRQVACHRANELNLGDAGTAAWQREHSIP